MPFRKDLRKFYQGPKWKATRERILERDNHQCVECGKRNRETVETFTYEAVMFWRAVWSGWRSCPPGAVPPREKKPRLIKVKIGVAHLNHVAGDDRDENLRSLCDFCHLKYDAAHHRESRADRKDAARPLLREIA